MVMECLSLVTNYQSKIKNKDDLTIDDCIETMKKIIRPKNYLSFTEKENLVLSILKKIISYSDEGKIQYNSCKKYITFILDMLSVYTNLRIDKYSYDILCSNNLLNIVIGSLGSEYDICLGIMEMYIDDLEHNRIDLRRM